MVQTNNNYNVPTKIPLTNGAYFRLKITFLRKF